MRIEHGGALIVIVPAGLPHPHGLVPGAGGQQLPGARPRHALHLVLVPLQGGIALKLPWKHCQMLVAYLVVVYFIPVMRIADRIIN